MRGQGLSDKSDPSDESDRSDSLEYAPRPITASRQFCPPSSRDSAMSSNRRADGG